MATVEAQIYYPKHISIWENVASVTGTIIIVQTNIHHRSKVTLTLYLSLNFCTIQYLVQHKYSTRVGVRRKTNPSVCHG